MYTWIKKGVFCIFFLRGKICNKIKVFIINKIKVFKNTSSHKIIRIPPLVSLGSRFLSGSGNNKHGILVRLCSYREQLFLILGKDGDINLYFTLFMTHLYKVIIHKLIDPCPALYLLSKFLFIIMIWRSYFCDSNFCSRAT